MNVLVIIYSVLFLWLCLKNLKAGLLLLLFSLPAYQIRFEILGVPTTILEINILLLFLVWLLKGLKKENICWVNLRENKLLLMGGGLFLLAASVAMLVAPNLRTAAGLWKAYFIEPILFLIVLVNIFNKKDLHKIYVVLSAQVLLISLLAIYQKLTGALISNPFWEAEATRRVTGPFAYPNALALYLAPIIILLIGWGISEMKKGGLKLKWVRIVSWLLFIGCSVSALYFTKSKGAMLAVLIGLMFYAVFYKNYRKLFACLLVLVAVVGIGYGLMFGWPNVSGAATVEGGDSFSTRIEMWQESWQMLKTRSILGAGLGGYQQAVEEFHTKDYIEIYLYPHNIVLNFWSEIGLLGLVAFVLILIWFFRTGFKNENYVLLAGMTTVVTHGLVDVPYFKNDLAVLFWLMTAMLFVEINKFNFENGHNKQKINF